MPGAELACVVCGAATTTDAAVYANGWERSRRRLPCCSPACAEKFHPDEHWVPSPMPELARSDEHGRLRMLARDRFAGLDQARPVVREMLLAGMRPAELRALVAEAREASANAQRSARRRSLVGMIVGVFGGGARLAHSRDQRSVASFVDAEADLDRWEALTAPESCAGAPRSW